MTRALLLLLLLIPARGQDELVLKWNQFARDANEYVNTIERDHAQRLKHKKRLQAEWNAVYPLL